MEKPLLHQDPTPRCSLHGAPRELPWPGGDGCQSLRGAARSPRDPGAPRTSAGWPGRSPGLLGSRHASAQTSYLTLSPPQPRGPGLVLPGCGAGPGGGPGPGPRGCCLLRRLFAMLHSAPFLFTDL